MMHQDVPLYLLAILALLLEQRRLTVGVEYLIAGIIAPFRLLQNYRKFRVWDLRPPRLVARDILANAEGASA